MIYTVYLAKVSKKLQNLNSKFVFNFFSKIELMNVKNFNTQSAVLPAPVRFGSQFFILAGLESVYFVDL